MKRLERIRHRWGSEMTGIGDEKGGKGSAALQFAFFTVREPRLQDERTEERRCLRSDRRVRLDLQHNSNNSQQNKGKGDERGEERPVRARGLSRGGHLTLFWSPLAQLVIPAITTDAESVKRTVLICAIFSVIALFPTLLIAERPPTPPSPSAANALLKTKEEPFLISLKKALTNPQFLLMMLVFGTFTACFSSFAALIAQFTAPYSYTSSEAGYFGAAMIFSGLLRASISAPFLDKFKHFNGFSKIMVIISSAMFIALNFAIRRNFFGGLMAISVILGISGFSVLPAGLEYGVEITYPVTPASSTSLLWGFGQLLTAIFLTILGVLQNDELSATKEINPPMIFIAVWAIVFGVVPMFIIKTQYLRAEAEEAMRQREKFGHQQQVPHVREC